MGNVIRLPKNHVRASLFSAVSRASRLAKASNVISDTPWSDASRAKASQCADGMPRTRQTLTVGVAKAKAKATAFVPPKASMTESDVIMAGNIVCIVQTCQEFATRQPTLGTKYGAMGPMIDPRETIVWRLQGLKEAYMADATDEAFARAIGLDKSTYSWIKKCERNLSFETGCYIKEKWGISLDWLFYGDLQQSAAQVMASLGRRPMPVAVEKTPQPIKPRKRKAG